MDRWLNRVALVTGAGSGIGAAISASLVKSGMIVIGCARNIPSIDKLAETLKSENQKGTLISYKCDMTKESEVEEMFSWIEKNFGGADVVVNNAGRATGVPLLELSTKEMREVLDLNVVATIQCAQLGVKSMLKRGINDGHIFNINSMLGHAITGIANFYSATKFSVTALTQGLRKELAEKGSRIKVTAISPGRTETNFHYTIMGERAKAFYENIESLNAQDVADAMMYALSAKDNVQVYDIQLQPTNLGNLSAYKAS